MKDSGIEWIGEIPEGWSNAWKTYFLALLQRAVFPTDGRYYLFPCLWRR